jgi:hypothetical protein
VPAIQPYINRSPSGSSFAPCCPKEKWITRSAAIGPAYPIYVVFEKLVEVLWSLDFNPDRQ